MATANPLEDQVTCSVCINIYRKPHMLIGCLHTFCLECIEQLERRGQIECPECRQVTKRKFVKSDFRTQGIIEIFHLQQTSKEKEIALAECGMCHSPDKPVTYYCMECDHYMCDGCQETHAGKKACKSYKVKSVAKTVENFFDEMIREFEKEQRKIHQRESQVDKIILTIEESERQHLGEVKQFTEDAIRDLKENEKRLNKIIKYANADLIKNLKENKEILTKGHAEIHNKIDVLNDITKGQDVISLMESAHNIKHSMNVLIEKIHSSLSHNQFNGNSLVTVKKGKDWNVEGCIEVKVGEVSYGSTALKPLLKSLYSELHNNEYLETKSVGLGHVPRKLVHINQEIWCCDGSTKINMYNKQCQKVKDVIQDNIYIRGLTRTHTNHVTLACIEGIHQLDINGQYQGHIADGSFSDVSTYGERVYALDWINCKVLVFKYINELRKISEIGLQYSNSAGSPYDKLCISKDSIYVSSIGNDCIFKYNFKGELQQEIRQDNNELHICGVDGRENLLVADYDNSQIYVYDQEGSWRLVPLSGEISGPIHALLDHDGSFWVANFDNETITKFDST